VSPETNLTSLPPDEAGFAEVAGLVSAARQQAYLAVNTSLINLYWQVGPYIIPGRFNCRTTGATIALDVKPHHSGTKQTSGGAGVLPPHGSSGTVEQARVGAAVPGCSLRADRPLPGKSRASSATNVSRSAEHLQRCLHLITISCEAM